MWDEAIFVDWSASFKKGKFKPREKKVEIGRHERLGEVFGKRNSWEHNLKIRIMPRWLREGARVRRRVEEGVRGGGGEGKLAIYNRILFIAERETNKLRNNIIWV